MFKELKHVLKEKPLLDILVLLTALIGLYIINEYIKTDYSMSEETRMRMAVIETLGGPCIPVIAQCCTSRNLFEGIYARRSDLPGGYCFHSDCDVVFTGNIFAEKQYTITAIRGNRQKDRKQ